MLTVLLNLIIACFRSSCSSAAHEFLLLLILVLYKLFMQKLTITFTPSSLTLVNSGLALLCMCSLLAMTWSFSRSVYQGVPPPEIAVSFGLLYFCLLFDQQVVLFFFSFIALETFPLLKKTTQQCSIFVSDCIVVLRSEWHTSGRKSVANCVSWCFVKVNWL